MSVGGIATLAWLLWTSVRRARSRALASARADRGTAAVLDRGPRVGRRYLLLAVGIAIPAVGGRRLRRVRRVPAVDLPPAAGAGSWRWPWPRGVAAFFSLCSFPLLATLLARHTRADQPAAMRVRRALLFATALSLGSVVFVLAVGALFALGGRGWRAR